MQFLHKSSDTKQLKRHANLHTSRIFLETITLKIVPNSALSLKRRKLLNFPNSFPEAHKHVLLYSIISKNAIVSTVSVSLLAFLVSILSKF